jgi:tetratricopeptide (TPR) repeat protein
MADETRTLRIRCRTWDQVEAFYKEKLRGNTLVVKMPVRPQLRETVTVALGLPDGLVFAIDGVVAKVADGVAGKYPVALRLLGLTDDVRGQLERLVGGARAGGTGPSPSVVPEPAPRPARGGETLVVAELPPVSALPVAEQGVYAALEAERARLLPLAAHEVLGVPPDVALPALRRAYFALTKAFHPDVHARHGSDAIRGLASEVFLHVNKAYDRLRGTFAKEALAGSPALSARDGWVVGAAAPLPPPPTAADDDSAYASVQVFQAPAGTSGEEGDEIAFTTSVRMKALTADDLFAGDDDAAVTQDRPIARTLTPPAPPEPPLAQTHHVEEGQAALNAGQFRVAAEHFASALRVDPRNRVVRALYHVANGLDLRQRGEGSKAQEQLEMALKHDPQSEAARRALAHDKDKEKRGLFKKLFEK